MPNFTYNEHRTFLVDQTATSLLLRGNMPLTHGGDFSYSQMESKIDNLVPGWNLQTANLLIVSLLDNRSPERSDLQLEFQSFGISPTDFDTLLPESVWPPHTNGVDLQTRYGTTVEGHNGSLLWYPVKGCTGADGCSVTEDSLYAFSALVDLLHTLLSEENTAVYFHCTTGNDRTGALAACYLMKYKGLTLAQVKEGLVPGGAMLIAKPWELGCDHLIDWYASTLV